MSQTIDPNVQRLAALNGYLEFLLSEYPAPDGEDESEDPHHASPKHLDRYVQEFAFRLNDGNVKRHTMDRLDSFITATSGLRLTYERLIA